MKTDLLKRYGGAVPRYTSYPTAPHFKEGISQEEVSGRLSRLPVDEPVSVYMHIPYCDTLCWFCGCHTKITRQYKPVGRYVDTLITEVRNLAARLPTGIQMSHLHWGGGSPTLLQPEDIQRLASAAKAYLTPATDFEFAVEIDPRDTGEERIAALAFSGLTRASIGVQDFDPMVQKAINRLQSFEETEACVRALRKYGVDSLNLDLMYGLPHQTLERTLSTVVQALSLRPDRVALFGYAHVPWMKSHQKMIDEDALPGPEERLEASEAAAALLLSRGYVQIGLDHFALPDDSMAGAVSDGTLRRNFQGYTTDKAETLLPIGASAIGRLPDMFLQNEPSLQSHARLVEEGQVPLKRGAVLSQDDRVRAAIIERLMCDFSADLPTIAASMGVDVSDFEESVTQLAPMQEDGLVRWEKGRLLITETGRPFLRQVAACFDQYFSRGAARHSAAV